MRIDSLKSCSSLFLLLILLVASPVRAEILIQSTPDNGTQPRMLVDDDGGIHLLYFKKRLRAPTAREGNLYYRQFSHEQKRFGPPVKVSSQAFGIHTFSIARAGLAMDGDGRVHVIWYRPRQSEFYYSRSNPERSSFEPQQAMVDQFGEGIDAGADIAALGNRVALVWGAGDLAREDERTVFARLSDDFGDSFSPAMPIGNPDLGACACCSLAVDYSDTDSLKVAYRSALDGVGRHMQHLTLEFEGDAIGNAYYGEVAPLQEWEASFCPLSTNDIVRDKGNESWLVFETESRIIEMNLEESGTPHAVGEPFTQTRQKNPALAINAANEHLLVWGEAISHSKGGRLNMRHTDAAGELLGSQFDDEITIPDYSFPAVADLPNGDFLVLY